MSAFALLIHTPEFAMKPGVLQSEMYETKSDTIRAEPPERNECYTLRVRHSRIQLTGRNLLN